jgi:hypothetical protein
MKRAPNNAAAAADPQPRARGDAYRIALRILLNTVATLSFLLFIATVALWIRSHYVSDWLMLRYRFDTDADRTYWTYYLLRTGNGAIGFERYTLDLGLRASRNLDEYRRRTPFLRAHDPAHPDEDVFPTHDAKLGQLPLPETITIKSRKIRELNQQRQTIRPDGKVSLNLLDEITVAGLSPLEAEARINAAVTKYYNDPDVRLEVETMFPPLAGARRDEHSFAGFKSHRATLTSRRWANRPAADRFRVIAPLCAPALLFSLPPLLWLLRHRRTRSRKKHNLCSHCGYDLRATPTQCPECGHLPRTHAPSSS